MTWVKVDISHGNQRMSILHMKYVHSQKIYEGLLLCRLFHQRDLHQIGTLFGCPAHIKRIQQESGQTDGLDIFQHVPAIPP